ncbi:MAG: hypothetical protein ACYCZ0_01825 [Minisyncoccota bacterium]
MAITYPLATSVFADEIKIVSISTRPGHQQELSGLGSGYTLAAEVAPALREFDVSTVLLTHAEAAEIMALIEALSGSIKEFYLYDPRYRYPAYDPDGTILGANTVQINSLNANDVSISLKGLPSGYVITRGDYMHWDYSSGPTRRAFHRAVETVTANGSGVTAEFEVRDIIRGGLVDATVTLIKPAMKCKMIPSSLSEESAGLSSTRISFSVRQVI